MISSTQTSLKKQLLGWNCGSMVQHMRSTHEVLASIPSTAKTKTQNKGKTQLPSEAFLTPLGG
jgi:hypothetical protein